MIPQNIINLINIIIEKTINRKAVWSKTSRDTEYKLDLDSGAITVDLWADGAGSRTTLYADIAIYNKNGNRIDYYQVEKGTSDYDILQKLHSEANKEYYKVDETIEGLFKEVNSDKNIGKKTITPKDLDDLPL